jgi:hypothetical protein
MGNLGILTPKDFAKNHHKEGHKELGWTYVKILVQKDIYCITSPFDYEDRFCDGADADGEYIIWKKDEPIAECRYLSHAMILLLTLELAAVKKENNK